MDEPWWRQHGVEVRQHFHGETVSIAAQVRRLKVTVLSSGGQGFRAYGNSGAGAISLACFAGAWRVLLLGFDCQRTGGKAHWHGDHPKGLGNAGSLPKWPGQFKKLREAFPDLEIINCSRETALTAFPRGRLEEWLAKAPPEHGARAYPQLHRAPRRSPRR